LGSASRDEKNRRERKKVRIALTIWEGRISPVFDVCREALVLTVERGAVAARSCEDVDALDAAARIRRLETLGVRTLICGAISEPLRRELCSRGIEVIGFVAGDVEEVVCAFLSGSLPNSALSMPGTCCGRRSRARGRGEGGRRRRGGFGRDN
jgi:predicted Fe-Mo cluster-binding NifX family protein